MPKIVDHEEQRSEIARVAINWIAQKGIDTLSQRNIAAASGRSKGNIQHYFPDKRSLMFGALRQITRDRSKREAEAESDLATDNALSDQNALSALCRRLSSSLPIDEARRNEWRVRLSLYAYANRDAEMQQYLADHASDIFEAGTRLLKTACEQGQIRPDIDPEIAFRLLSGTLAGIAVSALASGETLAVETQRNILNQSFELIKRE